MYVWVSGRGGERAWWVVCRWWSVGGGWWVGDGEGMRVSEVEPRVARHLLTVRMGGTCRRGVSPPIRRDKGGGSWYGTVHTSAPSLARVAGAIRRCASFRTRTFLSPSWSLSMAARMGAMPEPAASSSTKFTPAFWGGGQLLVGGSCLGYERWCVSWFFGVRFEYETGSWARLAAHMIRHKPTYPRKPPTHLPSASNASTLNPLPSAGVISTSSPGLASQIQAVPSVRWFHWLGWLGGWVDWLDRLIDCMGAQKTCEHNP